MVTLLKMFFFLIIGSSGMSILYENILKYLRDPYWHRYRYWKIAACFLGILILFTMTGLIGFSYMLQLITV